MFGEDFKSTKSQGTTAVTFLQRDKYFSRDTLIERLYPQRDGGGGMSEADNADRLRGSLGAMQRAHPSAFC